MSDLLGPFIFTTVNIKKRPVATVKASNMTWACALLLNFITSLKYYTYQDSTENINLHVAKDFSTKFFDALKSLFTFLVKGTFMNEVLESVVEGMIFL